MSKRDEQRRIREQKQQAAEVQAIRNKNLVKWSLYIGVPLLLAIIIYALIAQGRTYSPAVIAPDDHVRGDPEGVTLMVYADFQCPACATEHRIMAQAWNNISSKAQQVFRHYPLTNVHPHAWTAALYSEAAGRQGKFWEMHDLLFVNQAYWSTLADVDEEFDAYLQDLDLDIEQAQEDMRSDALIQKIRNDQRGGTRAGVRSTPALFVNGRLVPVPRNATELVNLVNQALPAAGEL